MLSIFFVLNSDNGNMPLFKANFERAISYLEVGNNFVRRGQRLAETCINLFLSFCRDTFISLHLMPIYERLIQQTRALIRGCLTTRNSNPCFNIFLSNEEAIGAFFPVEFIALSFLFENDVWPPRSECPLSFLPSPNLCLSRLLPIQCNLLCCLWKIKF